MQKLLTKPGDMFATQAGQFTVQRSIIREGVYGIEVLTSGPVALPIAGLSRSYTSRRLAAAIHDVIVRALSRDGADVEFARLAVVAFLDGQAVLQTAGVNGTRNRETLRGLRAGFAVAVA